MQLKPGEGGAQVIQNSKQLLFHYPPCYSCCKPCDKSYMRQGPDCEHIHGGHLFFFSGVLLYKLLMSTGYSDKGTTMHGINKRLNRKSTKTNNRCLDKTWFLKSVTKCTLWRRQCWAETMCLLSCRKWDIFKSNYILYTMLMINKFRHCNSTWVNQHWI